MLDYDSIVKSEYQLCHACPVIYEGITKSGIRFYFRLRHGNARLVFNEGQPNQKVATMAALYGLDGVCSYEEYKEMFVRLYRKMTR